MNARFFCHLEGCGRAFMAEEDLKIHLERRHLATIQEEKEETNDQQEKISQRLFGTKPENKILTVPTELSAELILESSGQEVLEDVTELVLRNKNLKEFVSNESLDLDEMMSLEYLCLSHNILTNIDGVSSLLGIRELNLNNNSIGDLSALETLVQLTRLFCSNNLIKVILPIKPLKQLAELSIYNNKLFDLDQTLKVLLEFPKLKILEIDRNPCVLQTKNSRYFILHKIKLESLDGELVTDVDEQITYDLFGEREIYVPKNLVGKLRTNALLQGSLERDLLYEEINDLKEKLTEVSHERDKLRLEKQNNTKHDIESLKDENIRLRREVASMYALLDDINELRNKMKESVGSIASDIYEENVRLRARVFELEKKIKDDTGFRRPHTSAGIRPATANSKEVASDEIFDFLEENQRMLVNLELKVSDFKKYLKKIGK